MAKKTARAILVLLGFALGPIIVATVNNLIDSSVYCRSNGIYSMSIVLLPVAVILIYILSSIITGLIIIFLSSKIINGLTKWLHSIEVRFSAMPTNEIVGGVIGIIIGLLIAFLLSTLTATIPLQWFGTLLNIVLYFVLAYLGWVIAVRRRGDIDTNGILKRGREKLTAKNVARPKVLDTSAIIDGRIFDICQTGVIEGVVLVPSFVLQELRHIADSSDVLKRNRGRRGLDILNRMQTELNVPIRVEEKDYDDLTEVDAKLIRLADEKSGVVVTTDYNLNKVAGVQRVPVLNVNDLANAIKSVVLPGEEITASIMKAGKEAGQGIAYLADGTMIVVEGGQEKVGETQQVIVTSVLQTSAGRMIFAKLK